LPLLVTVPIPIMSVFLVTHVSANSRIFGISIGGVRSSGL
jgi:hypothetical protein